MNSYGKLLTLLFFQTLLSFSLTGQSSQEARVHFDMDACSAFLYDASHMDYSEFSGMISNSSTATIEVLGTGLYRMDPNNNKHSCAPGINGSEAICVTYDDACEYNPGNDRSVLIDLLVTPSAGRSVNLSELSFYELSPRQFRWLGGGTGLNNYPTQFGIRILKDGVPVYTRSGIGTNREWTLQSFNFEGNADLEITEATMITFEFLAYCPIGTNAREAIWDLDELSIVFSEPCDVSGGEITGGPFEFCVGDGVADNIPADAITVTGSNGVNAQWVITDDQGNILGLPPTFSAVDFDGAGPGTCLVWYLRYDGEISGLEAGANANDLAGCFSLSNPIEVIRNQPSGGTLTGGPFEFCVGDGVADNIPADAITVTGSNGANAQWVITDDQGNILGLPPTFSAVDFDGAGPGTCLVWYLRYDGEISGLEAGANANDLEGCFSLSNPIEVIRNQPSGGTLTGGPFEFCVGDGVADNIPEDAITVSGSNGANAQWVITDDQGNILGLPPTFSAVDFDGAGPGTCLVWYLRYDGEISGLEAGANANDLEGCFSLSNPIEVIRNQPSGGTLTGGPFEFCVGDGVADNIPADAITVTGSNGANAQWVITDDQGNILGLPPTFSAVDFDGAGPGTCLVWYLRYDGEISGLEAGANANDLAGCFSLSNPIEVIRNQPSGGTLTGGPFEFCVGDGVADNIPEDAITVTGSNGANAQWVITDDQGNILGLPPTFSAVDFDGAGPGTCLVWYLRYDGEISGLEAGANANDLAGCYSLSNPIEVIRNQPSGGTLTGGPFEFCVGDGVADNIPADAITVTGSNGANAQWVITDDQGNILGLPPTFSAVDFDGAGPGTCLVWYLRYDGEISGLEAGANANDLAGCFSLSNPIEVIRNQPSGGTLTGGPFEFCVGDGVADNIPADAITVTGSNGENAQWVITDDQGNILGLPPTFSAVDFDGAGPGTCLVWYLRYDGEISGLEAGANANDLAGCFSLSNPIEVIRNQPSGGTLTGGPFEFCVGDGVADNIPEDAITVTGSNGANAQWVITDDQGNILGLPPTFSAVDFDGAGPGTCLVWYLRYDGEISGLEAGANANDLAGCFSLSNPIEVIRNQPSGGTLTGGPFEFCVGDGVADNIPEDAITVTGSNGANAQWVITDDQGNILGLPPTFSAVDFDGAGPGTCLVWYLRYDGEISGLEAGANASDLAGCFSLSNPIEVIRNQPSGGTLTGGPFEFCVGDGVADNIPEDAITVTGSNGANAQWIITDDQGNILGLPPTFSAVDFDGAGPGTCLVWYLRYDGEISGLEAGANANDLAGCFSLSNPIEVIRNQPSGGTLTGGPFEFNVGDGVADNIPDGAITLEGNTGANSQWVVTDDQGNILGLPPSPFVVDFDGAGAGTCLVWHLSYNGEISGLEGGANANDLMGCFSLSNPITVVRNDVSQPVGGTLTGGPFEFCVGDDVADNIPDGAITLEGNTGANSQWVVTDDQGNILGLPPSPFVVDFDGAGAGTCLVWHLSYNGEISGLEGGANANDLMGNFSLSNPITVVRNQPTGGTLTGGPFEFNVGDGVADNIPDGAITLEGNTGANSQWVVTDDQGNILGLPPSPFVVDFDGAGPGTCLVWHLSYDGEISGLEGGANANDLMGCYSLSNPITVVRNDVSQPVGGTLTGGPFEFCVGDDVADNIPDGAITLEGNTGENSQWVVTDDQGNILGLPPSPFVVDFDGAGAGTCLVWHLSYNGEISGLEGGANANDLMGNFSLSNPITVVRNQPTGGTLTGGPFEFNVGDGVADNIPDGAITLEGNTGANSQWVVTDDQGNILGLPPSPFVVDFDGAGPGTCLVWHLSYDGEISGLEGGANANDLMGCFSLSNPITVIRNDVSQPVGGTLAGGPFEFCVGDDVADNIPDGAITLEGNTGENSQWVVTDDQGNILGLPPSPFVVDFDGAGAGTCLVWHLSYNGEISGLEGGANANDLMGNFSLSNPITVVRNQPTGGTLTGGPFEFCVGDGVADTIAVDSIVLEGNTGANSQWVVTDDLGNILGLPPSFSAVDFDGAGVGTCLVWHLSYDGEISGLESGANANDLAGCFSLSNPITVNRVDCPGAVAQPNGRSINFSVYPNPVRDELVLELNQKMGEDTQVFILNSFGAVVTAINVLPGDTEKQVIDVSSLLQGTYFIRLNSPRSAKVKQFIKL